MRALTVQQPWAWAIIRGGKDVENRKTAWCYTGTLAIHAGLKYAGPVAHATVERLATQPLPALGAPRQDPALTFGAVIGVVDVIGAHKSGECGAAMRDEGCSPWADPFSAHLELANPRALAMPIECPGRLGLWALEPHIAAAVRRQLA